MARRPLTCAQIDRFRARATAAATRLFARHGFEAVTMRSVAEALGCSAMTPYRYFTSKEDLFAAVRTEAFRRFADAQEAAARVPGTSRRRLARLGEAYLLFALAEPDAYRIMFELRQPEAGAYPALDAEVRRSFSYLLSAMEALVSARKCAQLRSMRSRCPFCHGHRPHEESSRGATISADSSSGTGRGDALTHAHFAWAQVHGLASLHLAGKLTMGRTLAELAKALGRAGTASTPLSPEAPKQHSIRRRRES
jgi:AcrR family transcriptional regulator